MKHCVLVLDDEENIRKLLSGALERAGLEVRTAASAEEALELLKTEDIRVMFVDLQLERMDGIEFCRRVRKDRPVDCLFAITGHTSVFDLVKCREAGFDDYFIKPLDMGVLVKAAQNAFEKIERWKRR